MRIMTSGRTRTARRRIRSSTARASRGVTRSLRTTSGRAVTASSSARIGSETSRDELVVAPSLVDARREALGAGEGAPQEDLSVKNGPERGQRAPPRR